MICILYSNTVAFSYTNDELWIERLSDSLGINDLHGAILQAVFDLTEYAHAPRV